MTTTEQAKDFASIGGVWYEMPVTKWKHAITDVARICIWLENEEVEVFQFQGASTDGETDIPVLRTLGESVLDPVDSLYDEFGEGFRMLMRRMRERQSALTRSLAHRIARCGQWESECRKALDVDSNVFAMFLLAGDVLRFQKEITEMLGDDLRLSNLNPLVLLGLMERLLELLSSDSREETAWLANAVLCLTRHTIKLLPPWLLNLAPISQQLLEKTRAIREENPESPALPLLEEACGLLETPTE